MEGLPEELLLRCLAGAGGAAVAAAACCCRRLRSCAEHLKRLPVFCSAAATTRDGLEGAIRDAATRALAGCWGAVDFALLFVANYSSQALTKRKYSDPSDTSHTVEMLARVLGEDVPIIGCCSAGLMGVGPDSGPFEVDPLFSGPVPRELRRLLERSGRPLGPSRGVTVLLGRLPPGCVVRTFAARKFADVPAELNAALSLTGGEQPAAAGGGAAAVGGPAGGGAAGMRAAPQACVLMYSAPWPDGAWQPLVGGLAESYPDLVVVGGASSGHGGLFFSQGDGGRADGGGSPPPSPVCVGLVVCSAEAAPPPGPGGASDGGQQPLLAAAAVGVRGLGPVDGCSVFTDVAAAVSTHDGEDRVTVTRATRVPGTAAGPPTAAAAAAAAAPTRRSSRRAAAADLLEGQGAAGCGTEHLHRELNAVLQYQEDNLLVEELCVALWECPPGQTPAPFTGLEEQLEVRFMVSGSSKLDSATGHLSVSLFQGGTEGESLAAAPANHRQQARREWGDGGKPLCMQVVQLTGQGAQQMIRQGLQHAQRQLAARQPAAAAAPAMALAGGAAFLRDLYAAAARSAASAGARSAASAAIAFSCNGRGQGLYARRRPWTPPAVSDWLEFDPARWGEMQESRAIDEALGGEVPFAGGFMDGELGPPVWRECWAAAGPGVLSEFQGYTTMFVLLGCAVPP